MAIGGHVLALALVPEEQGNQSRRLALSLDLRAPVDERDDAGPGLGDGLPALWASEVERRDVDGAAGAGAEADQDRAPQSPESPAPRPPRVLGVSGGPAAARFGSLRCERAGRHGGEDTASPMREVPSHPGLSPTRPIGP